MTQWKITAAVSLLLIAIWGGWLARGTYERARMATKLQVQIKQANDAQDAVNVTNKENSAAEVARLTTQAADFELGRKLEDQAHADTSNGCGLSADRVERLRQR